MIKDNETRVETNRNPFTWSQKHCVDKKSKVVVKEKLTTGFMKGKELHVDALTDREYPLEYPHEPRSWIPEVRDGMLMSR